MKNKEITILVIGGPGSGKSTISQKILFELYSDINTVVLEDDNEMMSLNDLKLRLDSLSKELKITIKTVQSNKNGKSQRRNSTAVSE